MSRGDQESGQQSRRIGRYEVLGEIASGGMATVFLARSFGAKGFSRLVAIKRLHPHLESEEDFVQMFLDEARLAARIRHPNVVATLDVEDSDGLYIVMEYVEGVTLLMLSRAAARANDRTPVPVIIRILLDTLSGMQAAHELTDDDGNLLGLVHRDISPQNILIGSDGTARLTDFGIAKAASRLTVTRDGQLKGKISYMAPEQTKRVEIDRRVDVFAMGIVAWELFTAKRLFAGESDVEVLNHLLFEPIPTLCEHATALPAIIDQTVMKALERDPTKRYASAHEFADALERAAKMLGGPANHRTVAAFVQKVAGERIARERGRIATGAPPSSDANSTGSFRAQDGNPGPSRVRTGGAPAARPQDPFGPPATGRPAASPLSPGRYNAPSAGSGPRKASGTPDPGLRFDEAPERRNVVRAPTIAAPAGIARQPEPKPTMAGLGAPPVRPSGPSPFGARSTGSVPAPAPANRPVKATMIGMGHTAPSGARTDAPRPAARSEAARTAVRTDAARPESPAVRQPQGHSLTFGEHEFDEEMPTVAETVQPAGRPGAARPRAPQAGQSMGLRPPSTEPSPPPDEFLFEDGGMESTIVESSTPNAARRPAVPEPSVATHRRAPAPAPASSRALIPAAPAAVAHARASSALEDSVEEIPELFPDSEPPPPEGDSHSVEAIEPLQPHHRDDFAPRAGFDPLGDPSPTFSGADPAGASADDTASLFDPPLAVPTPSIAPSFPMPSPSSDGYSMGGLSGAEASPYLLASQNRPQVITAAMPSASPRRRPALWVVILLALAILATSIGVVAWRLSDALNHTVPTAAQGPAQPVHPGALRPSAPTSLPPPAVPSATRPATAVPSRPGAIPGTTPAPVPGTPGVVRTPGPAVPSAVPPAGVLPVPVVHTVPVAPVAPTAPVVTAAPVTQPDPVRPGASLPSAVPAVVPGTPTPDGRGRASGHHGSHGHHGHGAVESDIQTVPPFAGPAGHVATPTVVRTVPTENVRPVTTPAGPDPDAPTFNGNPYH